MVVNSDRESSYAQNETKAFRAISNGEGQGSRRIDTKMSLEEDVYTAFYCSLIKTEYREKSDE